MIYQKWPFSHAKRLEGLQSTSGAAYLAEEAHTFATLVILIRVFQRLCLPYMLTKCLDVFSCTCSQVILEMDGPVLVDLRAASQWWNSLWMGEFHLDRFPGKIASHEQCEKRLLVDYEKRDYHNIHIGDHWGWYGVMYVRCCCLIVIWCYMVFYGVIWCFTIQHIYIYIYIIGDDHNPWAEKSPASPSPTFFWRADMAAGVFAASNTI